jgi:hypothetical protein
MEGIGHAKGKRSRIMKASNRSRATNVAGIVSTILALLICSEQAISQPRVSAPPVIVQPGIVVHPELGVVYVMNKDGHVEAVGLTRGETRWTTATVAKPLAVNGDILVAQVQPQRPTNTLEFAMLNTRVGVASVRVARIALPGEVRVSTQETLQGKFLTGARSDANSVTVSWEFIPHHARGALDPEDTVKPRVARGTVRLNPSTGAIAALSAELSVPPGARAYKLTGRERIQQDSGAQFASPDGRHVLVSQRIADDRTWDNYRWTIYQRDGARLGETRSHLAFAPFAVQDLLLLFVTEPFTRLGENEQPIKLRALSLGSGREIWSKEIRDTKFRGPFPP